MSTNRDGRGSLFGVAFVGILVALPLMVGTLRVSGSAIVVEGETVTEDLYAIADRTFIEGTVEGDVFVVTSRLTIAGHVTGDVVGFVGGPASISGRVDGSVRLAAPTVRVEGTIGDDLALVSGDGDLVGEVGRDVLAITGGLAIEGRVGRDVRAQSFRVTIDDAVGRDVLVRADRVTLGADASVGGDVLYKASRDARVSDDSVVAGTLTRREVIAPVWAKAVTRVFAVLSLFGFVVAGLFGLWAFRGLSIRAVEAAERRPGRSALIGLGFLLGPPLLILPLFLTLVGIPVALVILVLWLIALFLGPLPAVTAVGKRIVSGRGGLALGLVTGAVLWRGAMWLLPLIATILYLGVLLVGLGAYGSAAWALRREHAVA